MAMNPRLLRPLASGKNPETLDWISRVYSNGGTVSTSTANAVNTFCNAIESAGLRDRFYRLNLFAGTGLNAALVPLYRGPSSGGTQYGNTTDTNNGPFVSGDYSETSGMVGNGTSKFLNTGFPGNTINADGLHLGAGILASDSTGSGFRNAIGVWRATSTQELSLYTRTNGRRTAQFGNYTGGTSFLAGSDENPVAAGNLVASYPTAYRNGVAFGTDATQSANYGAAHSMGVFCILQDGTSVTSATNARLGWYSIGATMTQQQVTDFNTAANVFYTAMGRA